MMRLALAVFGSVVVIAAGLFWFQSHETRPVAGPASQMDKKELATSQPPKTAETPAAPAPAPVPAPLSQAPQQAQTAQPPAQQLQPVSPASPPASGNQAVAQSSSMTTLAPPPLDPNTPEDVVMVSRPGLVIRGKSTWDDGYQTLVTSFEKLNAEATALNLPVTGRGVTIFVETDDQGFRFESVLPVASLPSQRPSQWPSEMRLGATPEGKAIRFVHKGPYDEIDSTYEAITAYLDVKGIEAKETLVEEYISLGRESGDGEIELYIYVQPK